MYGEQRRGGVVSTSCVGHILETRLKVDRVEIAQSPGQL